jgi:hypothetical protein
LGFNILILKVKSIGQKAKLSKEDRYISFVEIVTSCSLNLFDEKCQDTGIQNFMLDTQRYLISYQVALS